jgi:hypothetical protein
MIFDFLSLKELVKIRSLNFSFARLLKSGAVPSVFEITNDWKDEREEYKNDQI